MIELKLDDGDKVITLNTHEVEGKTLYKAQDLLKNYGMEGRQVGDTIRNWHRSIASKGLRQIDVHLVTSGSNDSRGSYVDKRNILKLAGYVDAVFEDAVYEAFEALTEARTEDALEATARVVNIRPALKSGKHLKPVLDTLQELTEQHPATFAKLVLEQSKSLCDQEFDKLIVGLRKYLAENYMHHYALSAAMIELEHRKGDRYSRAAKLRK